MKVAIWSNRSGHQIEWSDAFAAGLDKHGVEVERCGARDGIVECDLAVFWSARYTAIMKAQQSVGRDFLIMERGYIGDRTAWTSLAFNGLNGSGEFRNAHGQGPERFDANFAHLLKPWQVISDRAVIFGQVPGDMSIAGVDIDQWYVDAAREMRLRGYDVRFRPHPLAPNVRVPGVDLMPGKLDHALAWADYAVTFNSNTGVDAVMAGVPTIACHEGSMVWDIAGQGIDAAFEMPDRTEWASALAWSQWRMEEIESGDAWAHITGEG